MTSDDKDQNRALEVLSEVLRRISEGEDPEIEEIVTNRDQVVSRYQPVFSRDHLPELTEEEFRGFLKYKNNKHWKSIARVGGHFTDRMDEVRDALLILTDEARPIEDRLRELRPKDGDPKVPYLSRAILTPILLVHDPDTYGVWNNVSEEGMKELRLWPSVPDGADFADTYIAINGKLNALADRLEIDLWTLDALWYRVVQNKDLTTDTAPKQPDRETEPRATHLLHKWNPDYEPRTIELHEQVAEEKGSVWWGKIGSSASAEARVRKLQRQIDRGVPTYAFLYRPGEVWRTRLQEITADPEQVDDERFPNYYEKDDCVLFSRISDFEKLDSDFAQHQLVLESNPDPDRMPGALSNQATPLWVQLREPMVEPEPEPRKLTLDWLRERTLWPKEELQELVDDIEGDSPQVVLAGPPGTSKTWVAKHVARYLTNDRPSGHRIVQFHPSYGYEDFIEGLRPVSDEGGIAFKRVDGVVLQMVDGMADPEKTHVLVIDEMNRANLPRVFGELMYLFEYRGDGEEIQLQYTDGFSLPPGLKFIGTMNTADRSIRSIDVALRRRFDVFECWPDANILAQYYEREQNTNEVDDLIEGFERLNDQLRTHLDCHHTIGHTFFMASSMDGDRLRKVWRRKIGPLIEEYFFDQPDLAAEYTLDEFWSAP